MDAITRKVYTAERFTTEKNVGSEDGTEHPEWVRIGYVHTKDDHATWQGISNGMPYFATSKDWDPVKQEKKTVEFWDINKDFDKFYYDAEHGWTIFRVITGNDKFNRTVTRTQTYIWNEDEGCWFTKKGRGRRDITINVLEQNPLYNISSLLQYAKSFQIKVKDGAPDDVKDDIQAMVGVEFTRWGGKDFAGKVDYMSTSTTPFFATAGVFGGLTFSFRGESFGTPGRWEIKIGGRVDAYWEDLNPCPYREKEDGKREYLGVSKDGKRAYLEIAMERDIGALFGNAESFTTTASRRIKPWIDTARNPEVAEVTEYQWKRTGDYYYEKPEFTCTNQRGQGGRYPILRFSETELGKKWVIIAGTYRWSWDEGGTTIRIYDDRLNKWIAIPMQFSDVKKYTAPPPIPDDPDCCEESCPCCFSSKKKHEMSHAPQFGSDWPENSRRSVTNVKTRGSANPVCFKILNVIFFLILVAATVISVAVNGWDFENGTSLLFPAQITVVMSDVVFFLLLFFVIYLIAFQASSGVLFGAIGHLFWISNILSAAWVLVFMNATEQGWAVWTSAFLMIGLAVVLHITLLKLPTKWRYSTRLERTLVTMTFGVYAGWTVAGFASNILAILSFYDIDFADSNESIWLFYMPLVIVYWIFGFKSKNLFYLLVLEVYLLVLPFYGWPGHVIKSRGRDVGLFGGPGNVFSGGDADEWFQIHTLTGDVNTILPGAGDSNKVSLLRPEGQDFVGMNRIVFKSDDGSFDGWTEIEHFKIWLDVLKFETTRSKLDFRPDYYDCHVHTDSGHRFATILDAAPDCIELGLFSEFDVEGSEPTEAPTSTPIDGSVPESTLFAGTLALFNIFIVFALMGDDKPGK